MIGLDAVVRPWADGDDVRLERMFTRLSPTTLHRRFFTVSSKLDGPLRRALTDVDHRQHEALVAQVGDEIVALASYHLDNDDPTLADVAVLVEDGWQHHGVGRRLVRQLGRLADQRGVEHFHADVLADNRPVIGLNTRTTRAPHAHFEAGELTYDVPLRVA
jgi:GNAT superfamily N-acetyltransferase